MPDYPASGERRKMSQDQINRDRMLERVDANVANLIESHKHMTDTLVKHTIHDESRFEDFGKKIDSIERTSAFFYGKVYGGSAVVTAVVMFVMRVMFK